jgi:hypothetical protein
MLVYFSHTHLEIIEMCKYGVMFMISLYLEREGENAWRRRVMSIKYSLYFLSRHLKWSDVHDFLRPNRCGD